MSAILMERVEPLALTDKEFAELSKLHVRQVQRRMKRGQMPGKQIGRKWFVEYREAREWLKSQKPNEEGNASNA